MEPEFLVGILFLTLMPALSTAGVAALLFVWFDKTARATRVAMAAIIGPSLGFAPILLVVAVGGGVAGSSEEFLVVAAVMAPLVVLVGWPVAFFMTRALDRQRVVVDNSVFS